MTRRPRSRAGTSVSVSTARAACHADLADAFNALAHQLDSSAREFSRVARVVGRDGHMAARVETHEWVTGDSFNALIGDLVRPSAEVARVITAVGSGDLSQKMALEIEGKPVRGEFLRIGATANTMVDQLNDFANEVTRTRSHCAGLAATPAPGLPPSSAESGFMPNHAVKKLVADRVLDLDQIATELVVRASDSSVA